MSYSNTQTVIPIKIMTIPVHKFSILNRYRIYRTAVLTLYVKVIDIPPYSRLSGVKGVVSPHFSHLTLGLSLFLSSSGL